jgi:hypothetical protein
MYNFSLLDPRPIPAAIEANEKVFANPVYGVEVTVPALATKCSANLDPQHSDSNADLAAIEVALTAELPVDGMTLATVRADLDSVGAMALLSLRAESVFEKRLVEHHAWHEAYSAASDDCPFQDMREDGFYSAEWDRIEMVATADKFARGGWPGPKPLPTRNNLWPEESAGAESSRPLAAINAAVSDFKVPLAGRVSTMMTWLLTGEEPEQYRQQVEKERMDTITALESGAVSHRVASFAVWCNACAAYTSSSKEGGWYVCPNCGEMAFTEPRIAVVESTHRAATMVGYSLAPVVVALNSTFRQGSGDPYRKFTICAFEAKFAKIKNALTELASLEAGWGGSPTIGGSPQGISSTLTIDQVVEVVEKHLI